MRPRTPPVNASASASAAASGALMDEERERERNPAAGCHRKKVLGGVRAWLMIDLTGNAQLVEAGKHAIMRRACLPARDLRILDPLLSYPSTILGRERAIVVNLEHIKAIITAQEVLLLNSRDPAVEPVVLDLQRRLPMHFDALGQQVAGDGGGGLSDNDGEGNLKGAAATNSPAGGMSRVSSIANIPNSGAGLSDTHIPFSDVPSTSLQSRARDFKMAGASPSRAAGGPSVLPFEFRALEVCLEAACSCLDTETKMLEREAYPALDELTSKLSTLNLERVRQIKSRLVAISGRVQKVRDEIEQLLDDDEDMAEMYLTEKLLQMQEEASVTSASSRDHSNPMSPARFELIRKELQGDSIQVSKRTGGQLLQSEAIREISGGVEDLLHPGEAAKKVENPNSSSSSTSSSTSSTTSSRRKVDVEELEMLLEAYFVQIDGTINKLSALREYVDDTEDYINIMLDDKQNHLLQMGVLLTTATLVVSAFIVVTGIFGMNIEIALFDEDTYRTGAFVWVVGASLAGCVVLYVAAIAWCKYKRLIE